MQKQKTLRWFGGITRLHDWKKQVLCQVAFYRDRINNVYEKMNFTISSTYTFVYWSFAKPIKVLARRPPDR